MSGIVTTLLSVQWERDGEEQKEQHQAVTANDSLPYGQQVRDPFSFSLILRALSIVSFH
jgi:hypothetical protein